MDSMRKGTVFFLFLISAAVIGCGGLKKEPSVLRFNLGAEPETIDPARSTGLVEAKVELQCFEGLTRLGKNDEPVPGAAESWTISPDGKRYTFQLRESKWSNGDVVTAHDFEYAWKRALSPALASEYAYQLFYVKNGEKYNKGLVDKNKVGVKAVDDSTLSVELEAPTPYFLSLTAFPTLFPVHRKTVESDAETWASNPETYIGNGPFKLTQWKRRYEMRFEKNPNYWDAGNVKLDGLVYTMMEEATTALSSFESGQLDYIETPPFHEIERLKKEGKLSVSPLIATYFVRFNATKPPFTDARVRQTFCLALNRLEITRSVLKGGQEPALGFVPYGVPDAGGSDFRTNGGNLIKDGFQRSIVILSEKDYAKLQSAFKTLSYLYDTNELHKIIAETLQGMWKENLGLHVELRNVEWKVYLQNVRGLQYTLARARWYGDYMDAMTFLDMFVTDGGNNQTGWSNKKYDALIASAKKEKDIKKRSSHLHHAEKILMEELPVCPVFFLTDQYLSQPRVRNVQRSMMGMVDFKEAEIIK